ncbi:MAG: hypothetical protein WBP16_11010 [Ferruginibacter sp.]
MKCRLILILYILLIGSAVSAQNLTGTWESGAGGNYYKLVILQINDSCFGYTYDTGLGHCKANFIGSYNESSKKLVGLNPSFIEKSFFHSLSTYDLIYSEKQGVEYLRGKLGPKTTGAKIMSMGMPQLIWYKKISEQIDTTKLIAAKVEFYKNEVAVIKAEEKPEEKIAEVKDTVFTAPVPIQVQPAEATPIDLKVIKESRESALIETLVTQADSIRLVLYDNGEIDGDTVTVFYNGNMIINSIALSAKPFEIILPVNKTDTVNTIELMANNLGSIPPNTALMLIFAGNERHELRVSSDYKTNAQINIRYKETNE